MVTRRRRGDAVTWTGFVRFLACRQKRVCVLSVLIGRDSVRLARRRDNLRFLLRSFRDDDDDDDDDEEEEERLLGRTPPRAAQLQADGALCWRLWVMFLCVLQSCINTNVLCKWT